MPVDIAAARSAFEARRFERSKHMIGRVFDKSEEAILQDDGVWTSKDASLAGLLNALCGLEDYSSAAGGPGYLQIAAAAELLGLEMEFEPQKSMPPGIEYQECRK
jgi:hypothetical protein